MPLYEYFCRACESTFEALIMLSASRESACACPACGNSADRILSAVNFGTARRENTRPQACNRNGEPDVTSLKLPPPARLCWMDDQAAARVAAYKTGRGAEYDDTVAVRKELASKQGDGGSDDPQLGRGSHSPLSDPAVFANRRKAAQKEKLAESAAMKKPPLQGKDSL
jgi:putative FmdB family regulatory protein